MFKNNNVVDINDFEKEMKKRERKEKLVQGWNSFTRFIRDNHDVLVFVVPSAVAVFSGGTRLLSKGIARHTLEREIKFKESTIYDRSMGRYVELKRPLTTSEALEIERRKKNGEGLNNILYDMKLVKR